MPGPAAADDVLLGEARGETAHHDLKLLLVMVSGCCFWDVERSKNGFILDDMRGSISKQAWESKSGSAVPNTILVVSNFWVSIWSQNVALASTR